MSAILSLSRSPDQSDDEQNDRTDQSRDDAAMQVQVPFAHRWTSTYANDGITLRNTVTVAVATVAVAGVIALDWWLVTVAAAGVKRGDAWLRAHAEFSLGHVALSTLTLIVASLTVAGLLDPRRRGAQPATPSDLWRHET